MGGIFTNTQNTECDIIYIVRVYVCLKGIKQYVMMFLLNLLVIHIHSYCKTINYWRRFIWRN